MSFTARNDINVIQSADTSQIGALAGDDTYILTGYTLTGKEKITISDPLGKNSLELIDNLIIASSVVGMKGTSATLRLVLDNGAMITVLDAEKFTYQPSGNIVLGTDWTGMGFSDFVSRILKIEDLLSSGVTTGGSVMISNYDSLSLVELPVASTKTVYATSAAEAFFMALDGETNAYATTDLTQITLTDFNPYVDQILLDLPGKWSGQGSLDVVDDMDLDDQHTVSVQVDSINDSTVISFGVNLNNELITLTLSGVTDISSVWLSVQ
ncbi:hypothetical protein [Chromatium okenii]|jgi:hypothetical protein|uniref:hypothetical protein n=1 Tax=Chromatium okenii TaxID=61644 RepID=UPI0026F233A6|nr:hypothetical protein [Chromatium okenii]MBV5310597.1 hypothetical protein [Chromatium okenii]